MQVSGKALTASAVGAGLAVAATQASQIALTAPIAISADWMKLILPAVMAIAPFLISRFAPGLMPLWEWFKTLPMATEAGAYAKAAKVTAADPDCPVVRGKARQRLLEAFSQFHPGPTVTTESKIVLPPGVNDAK